MVSSTERPSRPSSPSFDSLDLGPEQQSLTARLDRALTALDGLRNRPTAAVGVVAAAVIVLGGAWWLGRPPTAASGPIIPRIATTVPGPDNSGPDPTGGPGPGSGSGSIDGEAAAPSTSTSTTAPDLLVHVAGAVLRPGVVRLRPGARIGEAVEAAGGARPGAEVHRLNLAAPVADGMQVVVPEAGEPVDHPAGTVPPGTPSGGGDPGPASGLRPLDLNQADAEQLETLHGIGPALAAAIVDWRTEQGPFRTVEQLLDVPGIGPSTLEGLIDEVTV